MKHLIKIGAIVAGATAGAAVGVLFAPERGAKITDHVLNKFKSGTNLLTKTKEELKSKLKAFVSSKEENFDAKLTFILDNAVDQTEELINILENKLSELKKGSTINSSKHLTQNDNNQLTDLKENNTEETHSDQQEDIVLKAAHSNPTDF